MECLILCLSRTVGWKRDRRIRSWVRSVLVGRCLEGGRIRSRRWVVYLRVRSDVLCLRRVFLVLPRRTGKVRRSGFHGFSFHKEGLCRDLGSRCSRAHPGVGQSRRA